MYRKFYSHRRNILAILSIATVSFWLPLTATSAQQSFPERAIGLIVPFGSGGATDVLARIVAQGYTDVADWNVAVENKAGAGGNIGAAHVASAVPNGYTWLLGTSGILTANPFLYRSMSYNADQDFAPIALIGSIPNVLVASKALGVSTVADLLEKAQKRPGELSYSSSGVGTSGHLAVQQLSLVTGMKGVHVPYKNAGQGHTDLVSGRIDFAIDNLPIMLPYITSGQLVPLAVTSPQRHPLLPDVPTMQEAGIDNYESTAWFGILVPKNVPHNTTERIIEVSRKVLGLQSVRDRLTAMGVTVGNQFGADFADFITSERNKMRSIIEKSGIEPQ